MVITNLVVALMIVSNVSERVMAFEVNECYLEKHPDVTKWFPNEFPLKPEPMIRERSVTNFVYSTRIEIGNLYGKCPKCGNKTNCYTPGDFLNLPIYGIFFNGAPWRECMKCRVEEVVNTSVWTKFIP